MTVIALAITSLPVAAQAQTRPPLTPAQVASIDRFVQAEMTVTHVPGAAVGVYSRGKLLLVKGYGFANVELRVPVRPETIFQSGSVGKQFTSAAIMLLVQQGRVSLNDSIVRYFPGAPASWKPIRVKNLLSHTSGLSEYATDTLTGPNGPFYLRLDFTEPQLLQKIEALPIENAPGAKWNYRNTNYVLLGILIHRVTGMFYADYLTQRIFKPLNMTSTRLISEHDIVPNRAAGYLWENGALKNQYWVSPSINSTADGALYFDVLDLAKWDAALYTNRILSAAGRRLTWTVFRLNDDKPNHAGYGFGWRIAAQNGHRVLEHSGAWQGFTCNISRFPNDELAVVVLTNLDSDHARPEYLSQVIAGLADAALMPAKLSAIADHKPRIRESLISLLDALQRGSNIRDRMSKDFAAETPEHAVAGIRRTAGRVWPGGTVTLVQRGPSPENGSLTISQFRISRGSQTMLVTYGLNAQGRVDLLFFEPDRAFRTREI